MGILNVTPDSFSDGGQYVRTDAAVDQAINLVQQGADIIDIGGESSRPFSQPVPVEEELERVLPAIESIRKITDIPISIDTTKAKVALEALKAGADIINDISALRFDPQMVQVVTAQKSPVILMHMKGTPRDMQVDPTYEDVVAEVAGFLYQQANWAISKGVPKDKIILDPGIGFGKKLEHNLALLRSLEQIGQGFPVLVGPSRKAFLGEITGILAPQERDIATLGAVAAAALKGAHIVRVHNVALTKQLLQVIDAIDSGRCWTDFPT